MRCCEQLTHIVVTALLALLMANQATDVGDGIYLSVSGQDAS
jgi:hypothetical protein